jgi:hypothetical protein
MQLVKKQRLQVKTKTTTYTALTSDELILCDSTGGGFSITLPPAANCKGKILEFKKIDNNTNTITLDGNSSETIDGDTTYTFNTYLDSVAIVSDGSNWWSLIKRAATQAEMEAGTSGNFWVPPNRAQFHPSAAKAWVLANFSAGSNASYNVSSITDVGGGAIEVNIATDFSSASYVTVATSQIDAAGTGATTIVAQTSHSPKTAGVTRINTLRADTFSGQDADLLNFVAFGDQ